MAAFLMIVRINAAPGREIAFNAWYDEEHVPDVLSVPGFKTSRRFRIVEGQGGCRFSYCALYEFETDDLVATMREMRDRAADGRMPLSPTLDPQLEFDILEVASTTPGGMRQ